MRILLTTLNSKYVHSNLALKYLYSMVAESYCDVEIKEFTINNEEGYIFAELIRGDYDLVCFSCYIWNIEKTIGLCKNLKKASPKTKILVGGPEVSYDYLEFMKENKWVDFLIRGEGEFAFYKLCHSLLDTEFQIEEIEGLAYRKDNKIFVNSDSPLLDFEQVPFPYKTATCEADKIIYYESVRGCPFRCSYCLSSIEKTVRPLSIERVRGDLGYFLFKKVKEVKFVDRTFNHDANRAYEIFKYIIENDNGITLFHMEICADLLDDRTIHLLSQARKDLFQFEVGIQSANPVVLEAVDRKKNIYPILYNVGRIMEMGNIHMHVDIIAGLPYEDMDSFKLSFDKIYSTKADNVQLGFLKLLKGTKMRKMCDDYGYVFRDNPPYEVVSNRFINAKEMITIKTIEKVLNLFYNKGGFESTLEYLIEELGGSPLEFYYQLGDYYYDSGFQHVSHKKEDLYRILNGFMEMIFEKDSERMAKGRLLLENDMEKTLNFDAVKRFNRKGWEIQF